MGAIFLHQLHEHLMSLRVQISLAVVLVFFGFNGVIYAARILDLREDHRAVTSAVERDYESLESVADATRNWYRVLNERTGTEFMTEGGFDWFWGSAWLSPATGEWPFFTYARDVNFNMDQFEVVDWTLIVRVVLSFLCIVLAYDGIAGESERGTLRLLLTNPISRLRVLLAKFAAHLAVLFTGFLLGSVLSLAILSLAEAVQLTGPVLRSYGLYAAVTIVYLSLILLLTLGVSALTRSSTSALVLMTLAWAVFSVVIPHSSFLMAAHLRELPTNFGEAPYDYMNEFRQGLQDDGLEPRDRELAAADGFALEQRYARLLGEAEKEQYRIGRANHRLQVARYELARAINLLSPAFAFQYTVEALLGSGLPKRQSFIDQVFQYRTALRDVLRHRDAADPDSPHVLFLPRFVSRQPLEEALIPRFRERALTPAEGLAFSVTPLVVLLVETLLAFLFARWSVNRADVTGYGMAEMG